MTSPALFPFRVPKSFSLPSLSYSLTSLVNLNRLCLPQLRFVTASPRPVSASWDVCADLLIGGSGLPPVTGEGGGKQRLGISSGKIFEKPSNVLSHHERDVSAMSPLTPLCRRNQKGMVVLGRVTSPENDSGRRTTRVQNVAP